MMITKTFHILILSLTAGFMGCTKKPKADQTIAKPSETIVVDSSPRTAIEIDFRFEQQLEGIIITPTRIPDGLSQLTCQIRDKIYSQCIDGLKIGNLASGAYSMIAVYTVEGKSYNQEFHFILEEGNLIDTVDSDKIKSPFLIFASEDTANIKNNASVVMSKGLDLSFSISIPENCTPKLMCNREGDRWSLCSPASNQTFSLKPHDMITGFQTLNVKASCPESDLESNTLTYTFYGVSDSYQNMGLRKVVQGKVSLLQLERFLDCFGTVSFECNTEENADFHACSNLQRHDSESKSIRARCTSPDKQLSTGPAFNIKG